MSCFFVSKTSYLEGCILKKIDTKKLYVACRVYDVETEIEPWIQYESFGKIEHDIYVDPKRILLLEENVDGKRVFVDCKTRRIVTPVEYCSSFESESTCSRSLYLSDFPLGPLSHERVRYFEQKNREVSFIVPFNKYVKDRLGLEFLDLSLSQARAILNFINLGEGKEFKLSYDSEVAEAQIQKKIYHIPVAKEKIKK